MSPKPPTTPLPATDDPYVLLDVQPGVSADQLRRAYLRRVKMYKPDRHPAEFRRIREAYDRLREQEAWFDAWRKAGEVIRQATEEHAARSDGDGEASCEGAEVDAGVGLDDDGEARASAQARASASGDVDTESRDARLDARDDADDRHDLDLDAAASDEPAAAANDDDDDDDDDAELDDREPSIADREVDLEGSAWETTAVPVRTPRPEDAAAQQLAELVAAVHVDLMKGRAERAADRLLTLEAARLSTHDAFDALLLEVCCAAVWEAPSRFETLVARYGDLVSAHDTEFRDGALLHRRTLADEVDAWCEAVRDWPELRRFVGYGSSLSGAEEAELGLTLGKRASAQPAGFLATLQRAGRVAPGIVALYVGMAESWAARFGLPRAESRPDRSPTIEQAAEAIAVTVRTHRIVRWAQWRPLVTVTVASVLLVLSPSPLFELVVIGLVVAMWAWRAWIRNEADALYLRVVQPTAAVWSWATGASPDELASALGPRLPARGTWSAFLHPVDPSVYPELMANDLTLLAFSVTAPMIPRKLGSGRRGSS